MCMRISDSLLRQIESDLGLNIRYIKGQGDIPVRNCWHFSTDGNAVDVLFWDDDDYRDGMNRIAVLAPSYKVIILAFALMDNHVHFVLYGNKSECDRFMHEYVRRTSMHIANRHGERHKLSDLPIDCQPVDTDYYLKVVICYVLKNATVAGKPFLPTDYPWSSGPLMFRTAGTWCAPYWIEPDGMRSESFGAEDTRAFLRTRDSSTRKWILTKDIVFPGEYVAYELAEKIFRSHKSFIYFMGLSKESEVDSRGGWISNLSIPDSEMRQHKQEICKELFGVNTVKSLDTSKRIKLARAIRARYQCSPKQVARLCGLVYAEVKDLI